MGEIREGFLEEVILELRSENRTGMSQVQRREPAILLTLLTLFRPSCFLQEVFLALSPRLGSQIVAVYLSLSLEPLQTGSFPRVGQGWAPLFLQCHPPGQRESQRGWGQQVVGAGARGRRS